jgi:uncharacterized protein YrrD
MATTSSIEGSPVVGEAQANLGRVEHVLFHPSEPRVVGLMLAPPPVGGMVKKPSTYVGLGGFAFEDGRVVLPSKKLPSKSKAEAALGADPELTVIWTGQPVAGPDGEEIGRIRNVRFSRSSGEVLELEVTAGMTADVAHGDLAVPGELVLGFERSAVRVSKTFSELEVSGGFAKTAATGAAVLTVKTEKARKKVAETTSAAVTDVAGKTGQAIRSVKEGSVPDKARSTWKSMVDAFKEGMGEDDDS